MGRALDSVLLAGVTPAALANSNLLVNGFMSVSQEWGDIELTAYNQYPADQWRVEGSGPSIGYGRVADPFPSMPGIRHGIRIRTVTGKPTLAGSDAVVLRQLIEGTRWAALGWGSASGGSPVTVGFMIRASVSGTGYAAIRTADFSRGFVTRFDYPAGDDKLVTFTVPADIAGTWANSTAACAALDITLTAGAAASPATAGIWEAGKAPYANDISNPFATTGSTVVIGGVFALPGRQLPGKEVWPFLARGYADEHRLCQRYFTTAGFEISGLTVTTARWDAMVDLAVPMRVGPTASLRIADIPVRAAGVAATVSMVLAGSSLSPKGGLIVLDRVASSWTIGAWVIGANASIVNFSARM